MPPVHVSFYPCPFESIWPFIPAFVKDLKFTNYPDIKDPNLMSSNKTKKSKMLKRQMNLRAFGVAPY